MLKLTTFAAIARQYGVPFEVQFTDKASFVWVGGRINEWKGSHFMHEVYKAGGRGWRIHNSGMRMTLESLT